jgi:uncharacterized protein
VDIDDRHVVSRVGVAIVDKLVHGALRWIFRELTVSDVGIDGHIEERVAGKATGRLLGVQIKSGASWFREPIEGGWVYRGDGLHLEYWLRYALPVVLVMVDVDDEVAYWQHIDGGQVERLRTGWKIVVPANQRLEASAGKALAALLGQSVANPNSSPEPVHAAFRPLGRATVADLVRVSIAGVDGNAMAVVRALAAAGLGGVEVLIGLPLPPTSTRVRVVLAGSHPANGLPSYVVLEADSGPAFVGQPRMGAGWVVPQGDASRRAQRACDALRQAVPLLHAQPDWVQPVAALSADAAVLDAVQSRLSDTAARTMADLLISSRPRVEIRGGPEFVDFYGLLLGQQDDAYHLVMATIAKALESDRKEIILIVGPSGSGKTTLGVRLVNRLIAKGRVALHSTGSRFLTTALRNLAPSSQTKRLFTYNNSFMDVRLNSIDVLVCDEAHRLRETSTNRYTSVANRTWKPQVRELMDVARVSVFLLDEDQVTRPGEIGSIALLEAAAHDIGAPLRRIELTEVYRWGGVGDYLNWVTRLLSRVNLRVVPVPPMTGYTVHIADSPAAMERELDGWRAKGHTARITAGFCWTWSPPTANGSLVPDVRIEDWARPWVVRGDRAVGDAPALMHWGSDPRGFGQIGMVYTAQGFDYSWCGVIIGPDLVWRHGGWEVRAKESKDPALRKATPADAERFILNAYRVLLTRARTGTIIYSVDPETLAFLRSCVSNPSVSSLDG